jgi:sugar lactone lactonase YvrE
MKKRIALTLLASGLMGLNTTAQTIGTVITNAPDDVVQLNEPYGVAVVEDQFFITDSVNGRVVQFDSNMGTKSVLNDGFFDPRGIVTARGGLVVSDAGFNSIRLLNTNGTSTVLAGSDVSSMEGGSGFVDGNGASVRFNSPAGLAVGSAGDVYIADQLNNAIRKLDAAGNVTTVASNLFKPAAVAYDGVGARLFIADTENHSILVLTNGAAAPVLYAGGGSNVKFGTTDGIGINARFLKPAGLLWVGGKTGLLVSDTGNALIREISESTPGIPQVVTYANSAKAGLVKPMGMAIDKDGNYPLVDLGANELLRIQVSLPQAPVTEPIIAVAIATTNAFQNLIWQAVAVTNATFYNDTNIVILTENDTEFHYVVGNDPTSLRDPTKDDPSTPTYMDGQSVANYTPRSVIEGVKNLTNVVIKAYGTASGRQSSKIVTAQVRFKVANPNILGINPATFTVDSATLGSRMYYTTNGIAPTTNDVPLFAGETPAILTGTNDVDFQVRAFKDGYESSSVMQKTFKFSDLQTTTIGVLKGYSAGIGSTILVPVQVKMAGTDSLKSLQFRVEVTPADQSSPEILAQFRPVDIGTNDFIKVISTGVNGTKALGNFSSYYFSTNKTRGLAISYIGTDANFSASDFSLVALLAVPVPPTAASGSSYSIKVLEASGTSDAQQTPVIFNTLPAQTIAVTNVAYTVGDSAMSSWYNAGDFGNGNLNNNDVNNAFYASLGVRTPYSFSDVFDAMDAFPVDTASAVGGDGQIRYLDWQVILMRSLRLDTNNWKRSWSAGGRRVTAGAILNNAPATPVMTQIVSADQPAWVRQAVVYSQPVENAQPGALIKVPVYLKAKDNNAVAGVQFRAEVEPVDNAPALVEPAVFVAAANQPAPTINVPGSSNDLPINQVAAAWGFKFENGHVGSVFANPMRNATLLGYIEFTVPATAVAGQTYVVRYLNADGAADINTQYDFETFPGVVWVGTTAQRPAEQISDEYKIKFFGSLNSRWAAVDADPDNDGVTNLQEYLAGKNPTKLRLHNLGAGWTTELQQHQFSLRWFTKQGLHYSIERATNLQAGDWSKVGDKVGNDDVQEVLDTDTGANNALFYRVIEQ